MAGAPAAPPQPGTKALKVETVGPSAAPDKAADYYDQRAKEVLAEEGKTATKYSPLQLAAPDYDIMVCEAGCDNGPRVMTRQLKSLARSVAPPKVPVPADSIILKQAECVGGCFDSPWRTGMAGGRHQQTAARAIGVDAGNWMTSVSPQAGAAPASVAARLASKPSRDDWMTRINRERETDKPAPASGPPQSPGT